MLNDMTANSYPFRLTYSFKVYANRDDAEDNIGTDIFESKIIWADTEKEAKEQAEYYLELMEGKFISLLPENQED
jgi:hypothetical protein